MSNVGKVFNLSGGGGSGSPKMESLTIATPPNKTVYKSGETFDPTGMVVVANYGEGLMANVTGYTVSPSVLMDGVSEVVITYTEGRITKTATVSVTVKKVLVSIAITTQPAKTVYQYQESLLRLGVDDGLQSGSQIALSNLGLVGQSRQTVNGNIDAVGGDGAVGLALSDEDVGDLIGQGQQSAVDLDAFQLVRLAAGSHQVIDLSGQAGNLSVDKADLALGAQRQFLELINSSVLGSRHVACPP